MTTGLIEHFTHSVYNTHRGDTMSKSLRKNITMKQEDYELISENAKKRHMSFSEFLCSSALQRIEEDANMDLGEFLNKYAKPASKQEQEDLERILKDYKYNEDDFEELTIDEILHG